MASLSNMAVFLDRELDVSAFADSSNNGLQMENSGRVRKVCCGVDASLEFFEQAKQRKADLLVCHHGISWNDSLKRITDLNYRRVALLIKNDMALYACHLPLDAHPRYGNNVLICKALRLHHVQKFGIVHGKAIGFMGKLPAATEYERFKKLVRKVVGHDIQTMDFGKKTVQTVAVVSGGAAEQLDEAGQKGIDVYLTGEPKLSAYIAAQEYKINAIYAGHYATEVFGVRALAALLKRRFKVEAEFIDLDIPY